MCSQTLGRCHEEKTLMKTKDTTGEIMSLGHNPRVLNWKELSPYTSFCKTWRSMGMKISFIDNFCTRQQRQERTAPLYSKSLTSSFIPFGCWVGTWTSHKSNESLACQWLILKIANIFYLRDRETKTILNLSYTFNAWRDKGTRGRTMHGMETLQPRKSWHMSAFFSWPSRLNLLRAQPLNRIPLSIFRSGISAWFPTSTLQ